MQIVQISLYYALNLDYYYPYYYPYYNQAPSTGGASLSEVRRAYLNRALSTHPDKGGTSCEFQEVVAAFEALSSDVSLLWIIIN